MTPELVITAGWLFVLMAAWIVALLRQRREADERTRKAQKQADMAQRRADNTERQLAHVIEYLEQTQEDRWRDFDHALSGLPTPDPQWGHYCRMHEMRALSLASYLGSSDPFTPETVQVLDLDLQTVSYRGQGRFYAWRRAGWLLMPERRFL
jgi:hypothetical protein